MVSGQCQRSVCGITAADAANQLYGLGSVDVQLFESSRQVATLTVTDYEMLKIFKYVSSVYNSNYVLAAGISMNQVHSIFLSFGGNIITVMLTDT